MCVCPYAHVCVCVACLDPSARWCRIWGKRTVQVPDTRTYDLRALPCYLHTPHSFPAAPLSVTLRMWVRSELTAPRTSSPRRTRSVHHHHRGIIITHDTTSSPSPLNSIDTATRGRDQYHRALSHSHPIFTGRAGNRGRKKNFRRNARGEGRRRPRPLFGFGLRSSVPAACCAGERGRGPVRRNGPKGSNHSHWPYARVSSTPAIGCMCTYPLTHSSTLST